MALASSARQATILTNLMDQTNTLRARRPWNGRRSGCRKAQNV
jgi:hypothetical protein